MVFMSFKQFSLIFGRVLVVIGALAYFVPCQARDLTDLNLEITTDKQGAEAKQEAFDKATEEATQKLTEQLLGADRADKLWPTARAKLLKNSSRFVVFIKGSTPQEANGATHITVTMRLSPDNLETILREEGLMNSGGVKVLPLVEFVDPQGVHYAWWADMGELNKGSTLTEMFKKFSTGLASKFKGRNIYVFDPMVASFRMSVPGSYRSTTLKREDQLLFAQYLKADVVVSGRVYITGTAPDMKLVYDLQMWQAKSGRGMAEEQRVAGLNSLNPKVVQAAVEQTDGKVFGDLLGKLTEALASGDLNLNVIRLAVNGNLTYRQEADLKRLLEQVREIKVLKERLFQPSRVVFEAEVAVPGTELAKTLQKTKFPQYAMQIESAQDDSLALDVKALSPSSAQ